MTENNKPQTYLSPYNQINKNWTSRNVFLVSYISSHVIQTILCHTHHLTSYISYAIHIFICQTYHLMSYISSFVTHILCHTYHLLPPPYISLFITHIILFIHIILCHTHHHLSHIIILSYISYVIHMFVCHTYHFMSYISSTVTHNYHHMSFVTHNYHLMSYISSFVTYLTLCHTYHRLSHISPYVIHIVCHTYHIIHTAHLMSYISFVTHIILFIQLTLCHTSSFVTHIILCHTCHCLSHMSCRHRPDGAAAAVTSLDIRLPTCTLKAHKKACHSLNSSSHLLAHTCFAYFSHRWKHLGPLDYTYIDYSSFSTNYDTLISSCDSSGPILCFIVILCSELCILTA